MTKSKILSTSGIVFIGMLLATAPVFAGNENGEPPTDKETETHQPIKPWRPQSSK